MSLRLSSAIRPTLVRLASIDDALFNALVSASQEAVPALSPTSFIEIVKQRCTGFSSEDVGAVAKAAFSLHSIFSQSNVSKDVFVADVVRTLSSDTKHWKTGMDQGTFSKRLRAILESLPLATSAKALNLLFESERHLVGTRIITDIRPIFGDDPSEIPAASVITHSLRLQYHEGNGLRELFVAMDPRDIRMLSEALNRAMRKEETLKKFLQETTIRNIDTAPKGDDI
jgi:hypothetical protein